MAQRTIFGIENHRFFVSGNCAHGERIWYPTRAERDAARADLVERAGKAGLADPDEAMRPIKRAVRGDAAGMWLDELTDNGEIRTQDGPVHIWGPAR